MVDWLKANVSVVLAIITLAGGGVISASRLSDQVTALQKQVAVIEKDGTETTRNLQKKVDGLEVQNNELAKQMKETKEVLLKLDKRVGYLLCRQDKRFCVE